MALDARLASRKSWRVSPSVEADPDWVCARLTLELETGTVVLRLSPEDCARVAKKLLLFAARDVGLKVESGFAPLVDLANKLNRTFGRGD